MKEGDRGEVDKDKATTQRRQRLSEVSEKERQRMALCVHQLTTAWDVGGGSVTVYVYVWSYILSSLWTLH